MKKLAITLVLLLSFLAVAACGSQSTPHLTQEEIDRILNDKIADLRSVGNYEEYGDQLEAVRFDESDVPQILTINDIDCYSVIRVHSYDKEWKVVYENAEHNNSGGFENLRIMETPTIEDDSSLQRAIIGLQAGSGGYLSFIVLGNYEGKIVPYLSRTGIEDQVPQGTVHSEGNEIVIESAGQVVERIELTEPIVASAIEPQAQEASKDATASGKVDDEIMRERYTSGYYTKDNWEQAMEDIAQLEKQYHRSTYYEALAEELPFTDEEIEQFYYDLLEAYELGQYKRSILNDDVRFIVELLFKSLKIENHYETVLNDKDNPKAKFAGALGDYVTYSYEHSREGERFGAAHNKRVDALELAYDNLRKAGLFED